jgi:hypothetical protein
MENVRSTAIDDLPHAGFRDAAAYSGHGLARQAAPGTRAIARRKPSSPDEQRLNGARALFAWGYGRVWLPAKCFFTMSLMKHDLAVRS